MPAFAFTVRELEGSRRAIELRDRSLPYRPIEWPGEQHYVQKWYPGNRVATVQVLGPREGQVEIRGTWKSQFVVNQVRLIGFDDLEAGAFDRATDFPGLTPPVYFAEDIVEAFARLRIAGNTLQVNWGTEVRRGILSRFSPNYQRIEDIEWSATFIWTQRGELPAPRAATADDPRDGLFSAMNDLDDTLAQEPTAVLAGPSGDIRSAVDDLRNNVVSFTGELASIQRTATVATEELQALQAIADRVLQAGRAVKNRTLDFPYVQLLPLDTVSLITETEVWRRTIGRNTSRVQARTVQAVNLVEQRAVPSVQRVVVVRDNETLRSLAQQFYGSSESWPVIADANGLVSSVVPTGTRLFIPRSPDAGSGVSVA